MLRSYESIFISSPTVGPDGHEELVNTFKEVITSHGGKLQNTIDWGRRSLAYEIDKFREGIYTIFEFEGEGDTVRELERRYRLHDSVLKFITVKTERKKKLLKKGAARRKSKSKSAEPAKRGDAADGA
jgi:small subunit ribosomal protein S6